MIQAHCPHCGQYLESDAVHGGQVAACPLCTKLLTLPSDPGPPPAGAFNTAIVTRPPGHNRVGFECPFCHTHEPPIRRSKVSILGWIVFAVLLLTCFPLCFVGFLFTDSVPVCRHCWIKLG